MSSNVNEAGLSAGAMDVHRALASFQEELEAIDYYHQRMEKTADPELRSVLEHNRNEEIEHATMLYEWLRRTLPEFDTQAKTFIFSQGSLSDKEDSDAETDPAKLDPGTGLGIGHLK